MSCTAWIRSLGTALLMGRSILPSQAEPFDPEDISFAYGGFTFSEAFQTSWAAILAQDVPGYVKNTGQDLRLSAAAAAIWEDLR